MDWLDYGARFYDAQLGRFHVIDPMIEDHFDYTGYAYCYNNPISFIDPLGLDTINVVVEGEDGSRTAQWNTETESLTEFMKREFGIGNSEDSESSEEEGDEYDQNGGIPLYGQGNGCWSPREKAKYTENPIDISAFFPSPAWGKTNFGPNKLSGSGNLFDLVKFIQDLFSSDEESPKAKKLESKNLSPSSSKSEADKRFGDSTLIENYGPGYNGGVISHDMRHNKTLETRRINSAKELQYLERLQKVK